MSVVYAGESPTWNKLWSGKECIECDKRSVGPHRIWSEREVGRLLLAEGENQVISV